MFVFFKLFNEYRREETSVSCYKFHMSKLLIKLKHKWLRVQPLSLGPLSLSPDMRSCMGVNINNSGSSSGVNIINSGSNDKFTRIAKSKD